MQRRQVEQLLHVHVGSARNTPQPIGNLLRDGVVGCHVGANQLNVDGRGQAEVQDLGDDVGRLEEKLHTGKLPRQTLAQLADVVRCGMMVLLIQAHQDFRVAGADHAGIAVGKIDAGVRQPDVVEDRDQFVFRDLLPQILLDFIAKPCGFFHPQSGAAANVEPHLPGIDAGEEILAQKKHQQQGKYAEGEKASREQPCGAPAWFPAADSSRCGTYRSRAQSAR